MEGLAVGERGSEGAFSKKILTAPVRRSSYGFLFVTEQAVSLLLSNKVNISYESFNDLEPRAGIEPKRLRFRLQNPKIHALFKRNASLVIH